LGTCLAPDWIPHIAKTIHTQALSRLIEPLYMPISGAPTQTTTRCPKWFVRINKWVKVLPTGRSKQTAEAEPTHS
jgi:hypothetical protein